MSSSRIWNKLSKSSTSLPKTMGYSTKWVKTEDTSFIMRLHLIKCINIVDIQYCFVYLFPIIFVSILSYPKLVFSCFASFDPFFLNCTRLLSIFHFFFQFISKTIKVNTRTTVEDIANVFMCRLTSIAIDLC